MKTFGVLINKFNISQPAFLITLQLNKLLEQDSDVSPIVFHQDYGPFPACPQFSTMLEIEAWDFEGPLISTSLATTQTILMCPRATRRLFYVWDLEWLYMKDVQFDYLNDIYQNDNIELIARSRSHYDALKTCWKKPIGIIEDFNTKQILKHI